MVLEVGTVPDGGAIGVEVGTPDGDVLAYLNVVTLVTVKFLKPPPATAKLKPLRSAIEKLLDRASFVDIPVAF